MLAFGRTQLQEPVHPLALRDVLHHPSHPHGHAHGVARHIAAIEHLGPGSVRPAEAVFAAAALPGAVQDGLDALGDAAPVLWMDILSPPSAGQLDLVRRVAEERRHGVVPPNRIGLEIPVPDDVIRGTEG